MSDAYVLPMVPDRRLPGWGTAVSLVIHLGFAAALLVVSPLRTIVVPPPPPVAVEIVSAAQYAALTRPAPPVLATPQLPESTLPPAETVAPVPANPATPAAPGTPTVPQTDRGVVTATEFYAGGILKEPGMERIRRVMGTLDPGERMVQLCNIEGLEQIRRAAPSYDPDTLVSYAMADTTATGLTLSATGGAFRSRRKWYGVSFQCSIAADYSAVTAFSFKLGAAIPEDEWEDHNLNAEDEDE